MAMLATASAGSCFSAYEGLGKVAVRVSSALSKNRHRRLAKQAVKGLLVGAIGDGRLRREELAQKLASELEG